MISVNFWAIFAWELIVEFPALYFLPAKQANIERKTILFLLIIEKSSVSLVWSCQTLAAIPKPYSTSVLSTDSFFSQFFLPQRTASTIWGTAFAGWSGEVHRHLEKILTQKSVKKNLLVTASVHARVCEWARAWTQLIHGRAICRCYFLELEDDFIVLIFILDVLLPEHGNNLKPP